MDILAILPKRPGYRGQWPDRFESVQWQPRTTKRTAREVAAGCEATLIVAESLFVTLECELLDRIVWKPHNPYHGLEAVLVSVELAPEAGKPSGEHVLNLLARLKSQQPTAKESEAVTQELVSRNA